MWEVADVLLQVTRPEETSCKSPDQEIKAARANRLESKGIASSKFSVLAEK